MHVTTDVASIRQEMTFQLERGSREFTKEISYDVAFRDEIVAVDSASRVTLADRTYTRGFFSIGDERRLNVEGLQSKVRRTGDQLVLEPTGDEELPKELLGIIMPSDFKFGVRGQPSEGRPLGQAFPVPPKRIARYMRDIPEESILGGSQAEGIYEAIEEGRIRYTVRFDYQLSEYLPETFDCASPVRFTGTLEMVSPEGGGLPMELHEKSRISGTGRMVDRRVRHLEMAFTIETDRRARTWQE